jgi:hypothetical protein
MFIFITFKQILISSLPSSRYSCLYSLISSKYSHLHYLQANTHIFINFKQILISSLSSSRYSCLSSLIQANTHIFTPFKQIFMSIFINLKQIHLHYLQANTHIFINFKQILISSLPSSRYSCLSSLIQANTHIFTIFKQILMSIFINLKQIQSTTTQDVIKPTVLPGNPHFSNISIHLIVTTT